MDLDPVLLSRIQFALTIAFHYIFPPLTIGMGVVLVYLGFMHLRTGEMIYRQAQKFWTKIFGLNFAIGVASGIVMEFQFGTNWAIYSRFVGDVFGSALAAEGIFAFFLESGFLAVLVFGWDKVSKGMHFFATCMVALGSIFSSIWIVVANSWQQTPAGSKIVGYMQGDVLAGRAEIVDFWQVVFNPSTVHRLTHVLIGCFIMGSFFIMSISAWYILKGRHEEFAKRSFTGALMLATVSSVAMLVSGHLQAKNVYEHQPAKMAAFEGHFETGPGDLSIIGWPDVEAGEMTYNLAIPGGLSFLLHEDFEEPVVGLDKFRPEDQPPIVISFMSYHIMVALGTFFLVLTLVGSFLRWRGTLFRKRWLMWIFVVSVLGAVVANEIGWVAAEVGRQPWIVHPQVEWNDDGSIATGEDGYVEYPKVTIEADGQSKTIVAGLRTKEAASKAVSGGEVMASIIMFGFIYVLLGLVWLFVLDAKIKHGPDLEPDGGEGEGGFLDAASARPQRGERMVRDSEPVDDELIENTLGHHEHTDDPSQGETDNDRSA